MPKGTLMNDNGSYDAVVDGYDFRWRFRGKKVMLFIRYDPLRNTSSKENYVFPFLDTYTHPDYDW